MPYTAWQAVQDPDWPHGKRIYLRSSYFEELTPAAADLMAERLLARRSPLSLIGMHQVGGAVRDAPADATAYSHRSPEWNVQFIGGWEDEPDGREVETAWARESWAALEPYTTGEIYANFVGDVGERAYRGRYDRLAALKRKYDPTNLFRFNQNVKPA